MSKYDDQYDGNLCICPYCGSSYQVECEDYSEDRREEECGDCGRTYYLSQIFSVDHHTEPNCELNGDEHDYQPASVGGGRTHPFCAVCGKCQPHGQLAGSDAPQPADDKPDPTGT